MCCSLTFRCCAFQCTIPRDRIRDKWVCCCRISSQSPNWVQGQNPIEIIKLELGMSLMILYPQKVQNQYCLPVCAPHCLFTQWSAIQWAGRPWWRCYALLDQLGVSSKDSFLDANLEEQVTESARVSIYFDADVYCDAEALHHNTGRRGKGEPL